MSRLLLVAVLLAGCVKQTPSPVPEAPPLSGAVATEPAAAQQPLDLNSLDPKSGPSVRFAFGWQDGDRATVTHKVVALQLNGDVMSSKTTTSAVWQERFEGTEDGHTLRQSEGEGGTRIEPPPAGADAMESVMTALTLASIESVIAVDGSFRGIDGLDGMKSEVAGRVAPVMDRLPPPLQQALRDTLEQGMQPDVVEGDARTRWDSVVGHWIGRELEVDVPVEATDPNGRTVTTTVLGWVSCTTGGTERGCILVERKTPGTEEDVARAEAEVRQAVAGAWPTGAAQPELVASELITRELLVTEPGTLRPYAYSKRKAASHTFMLENRPVPWGRDLRTQTWWSWQAMGRP